MKNEILLSDLIKFPTDDIARVVSATVSKRVLEECQPPTSLLRQRQSSCQNQLMILPPPSLQRDMINTLDFALSTRSTAFYSTVASRGLLKQQRQSQRKIEKLYVLRLLWRFVHVGFEFRYGAGGSSIAAGIRLGGIYHPSSPAFKLFEHWDRVISFASRRPSQFWPAYLKSKMRKLRCIYQNKEADPQDVNDANKNVFHVRIKSSQ